MCGVPPGNKVLNKYPIPDWILKNKEYFRRFVQRAFSCEGTVWGFPNPGIRIEFWKDISIMENGKYFLESMSFYLEKYFKIKTTSIFTIKTKNFNKNGSITKPLRFNIKRKDSIIRFYKEIGFENKHKQEKLKQIVSKWGNGAVTTAVSSLGDLDPI